MSHDHGTAVSIVEQGPFCEWDLCRAPIAAAPRQGCGSCYRHANGTWIGPAPSSADTPSPHDVAAARPARAPSPDLRDIVRARMIELNGGCEKGAQRALAKRLAKPWDLDNWKAAERKLILWFRRGENRTDMTTEPFSVLLDVLGLELRPKED